MSLTISPSPFGSLVVSVAETGSTLSVTTVATSPSVLTMALGVPGPTGATGATGATGQGVAAGGTTGQALVKLSGTNYDTGWASINSAAWGNITGTLSSQTDLQNALNAKLSTSAAASTYQTQAGMSAFLSTASAVANYQTISGMSAYLSTSAAASTYLPLTGGTMTGTIYGSNDGDFGLITYQATDGIDPIQGIVKLGSANVSGTDNAFVGVIGDAQTLGLYASGNTFIKFGDGSTQASAFLGYSGTTSQYIRGDGSLNTFPAVGDRYLTSSTSTLTCDSGNGKTMTIGTGLSYSRQQDITVSYSNSIHMHGTVLTYDSATGVMTFDANTHSGSGTYSSWQVNVGGVAGAILPVSGTAGQVLAKINSTNFNTEWISLGTMSTEPASAYLSTASAVANYLTISSASSTYQTQAGMSAYLSTSAASSTYQTQAGMSAYLSTASAVANYLTISDAASTYLTQSSASSTYIAQASFATSTQAQAGTSTTTVISPSTLLDAKYFQGGKSMVQITWSTSVSGTGATASAQNSNARLNVAPTTATGYAIASAVIANNSRGSGYNSGFDFSKRVQFGVRVARNVASPDTASVFRFSIGKSSATDASDLSARGLMIKVAGSGALQLLVHNGTALTTTTSSFTPANSQAYDVIVTSDGAGNCALFVNGSSVATSTGGPTTAGATNAGFLMFEVQNTSVITGSPQNISVSDYHVQVNS